MILDALDKLSAAQQVTADAVSTNAIDLGNLTPKRRFGVGEPVGIGVFITAVGTNTGSAKLQAVYSAATGLTAPIIVGEVDLATADIAAGKSYFIPVTPGGPAALEFLGANYDITGTVDFTVDSYVMPQSTFAQLSETYAKGYAIQ